MAWATGATVRVIAMDASAVNESFIVVWSGVVWCVVLLAAIQDDAFSIRIPNSNRMITPNHLKKSFRRRTRKSSSRDESKGERG